MGQAVKDFDSAVLEALAMKENPETYKHPGTRAQERLNKALDTYMALREKLGGHVSDEGKELAAAYKEVQFYRKNPVESGIIYG